MFTGTKPQTIVKLFVKGWQQQRIVNSDPFFCKFIVGKRVLARACHGFRPIKSGSARHKHHLALKKKSQEFSKQKYFIATPWTSSVCKSRNKSTKKKVTNSLSLPMLPKHQLIILLSIVNLFLLQKGLSRSVLDHWHFAHCFHSLYKSSFYENTVMTPSRLCSGVLQCLLIWKMIFQLAVKNCRFSKIQFC